MRHPMMSVLEQNPVLPAVKDTGRLEACLAQPAGWCSCCAGTF